MTQAIIWALLIFWCVTSHAQGSVLSISALNGKNGKPITKKHLLVFTGKTEEAVFRHSAHVDLFTNKLGIAQFSLKNADIRFLQVWVDGHILCQVDPNHKSYSVAAIQSSGLQTPNICGGKSSEAMEAIILRFLRVRTVYLKD